MTELDIDVAIYYFFDDAKFSIDWFAPNTEEMKRDPFKFYVILKRVKCKPMYAGSQIDMMNDMVRRYTIADPFTILRDGKPFRKIRSPRLVARITELLLKQSKDDNS